MVLTCLSVVVDGALAIAWTVRSGQSGISFEKLKAGSIATRSAFVYRVPPARM